jgi:hypothetical protein
LETNSATGFAFFFFFFKEKETQVAENATANSVDSSNS